MALLKDTDYFLVSDDNASYRIQKSDLKNEIGGSQVIVSETPPDFVTDGLEEGTLWWDNSGDDARLYILYNDPDNGLIWVDASPPGGGGVVAPDVDIKTPTVLTPPDGAGIGGDKTYTPKTSEITNVDSKSVSGYAVMPGSQRFNHITYGDDRFVSITSDSSTRTESLVSTDGENWTVHENVFGGESVQNEFISSRS